MTIPNLPPYSDPEVPDGREPSPDLPPDGPRQDEPIPDGTIDEPGWKAPGTPEDYDAPMRMPSENPDVETEL
jgi:hypothetical protein